MDAFRAAYGDWGLWIILIKGLTPIPFKVVTIASGAARFDPVIFVLAALATRGARFFLVAALIRRFGAPIRDFIERRLTLATTLFAICLVGGFVALRYILPR
jgi:membrane protein DedA with SNARE-associated domain